MSTTTTSSSNPTPPPRHHSPPPSSITTTTNVGPKTPLSMPRGVDSSPWSQIVRGIDSDSINLFSSASSTLVVDTNNSTDSGALSAGGEVIDRIAEHSDDRRGEKLVSSNDEAVVENGGGKTVWKKAYLGDVAQEVSPLMGVAAWPALSESTKASPKALSSSDGSLFLPHQGTGMSASSSPRKGNYTNTNPSSHTNHTAPARQKSFRRGNGGGSGNPSNNMTTNGGFSMAPSSQGFGVESAPNSNGKLANSESLSEENSQSGVYGPQSNSGGEHQQRNSYRRGTGGAHPRGNGYHYTNHGGRRDQDRGNHDRNPNRNFGGRGTQMQPQRGSARPFVRGPPHPNTSYVPPLFPVHPSFGTPMVYPSPEVFYIPGSYPDPFRAGPMVPPMGPVFYSFVDPVLQTKIVNQIEYYFSTENLVGDTYLRKNMDEQGWVSIKLIAGFKKVSQLTDNVQVILAALQASRLVEVEGEKLRRQDDWERWILPPTVQPINVPSLQSVKDSGQERLTVQLQNVSLDESSGRNVDLGNHPS